MEGLCFNFLLSQMFYNDYFLLLKQKKKIVKDHSHLVIRLKR